MSAAVDVLKEALRNEARAAAFYELAAEVTQDDESRMLFLEMVDFEEGHARTLVERVGGSATFKGFDAAAYVKELESSVETTLKRTETDVIVNGTIRQVLELAIKMEQRAQETYETLAAHAENEEVESLCRDQAREEEQHARALHRMLGSLDMDEEDRPGL